MQAIETQDKQFHDGNGTTELGTILPAWWLNQVQSELLGVLTAANIAPNKARTNQLAEAIQKLFPNKNFTLTAGAGLTGGGDLSVNRTIGLATPSTLSGSTANWSGNGAAGHTHEIAKATPTLAGVVKLVNALNSAATDAALTAAKGKELSELIAAAVSGSLNLRGALGDTLNLNDLTAPNHVGVWHQSANAYAVPERNYPVKLAGTLLVLPAVAGGTQIYIQYSGYVIWLRTQTGSTSGWGEWRQLGDDKLGNSGNQTLNGILTFNNPTTWAAWYATTRSGQWRFETNPVGDTVEGGKRFNFVFTGADNTEKARVAFPDPEGTQTVAYQSWVKEQIIGSDPVNRSGIDLDATTTPQFFINASNGYVSTVGTEHAGLVLGYRNDCTQLIAAGGNLWVRGSDNNPISDPSHWSPWRRLLDESNGVMLTGDQTIAGSKTFSGSLKTTSTITSGGDVVISGANNRTARFGNGSTDCFIHNPISNRYLQLKDDGTLAYSDDKIMLYSDRSDAVNLDRTDKLATSKAVKIAYDKAVDNAVTGSMASTGYVRLPNGLILQWGIASGDGGGNVNFPIAFPSALYMVNLSEAHSDGTGNFYQPSWVRNSSSNTAFAWRATGNIGLFSWFAIGR